MNYLAAAALSFGVDTMAKAESVEHFKGESAESLEEAVTNFKRYNQRLESLLKKDSMSADDVTKVPLVGDLPVIGALFRNTSTIYQKRELLIFVTPKIMNENSYEYQIEENKQNGHNTLTPLNRKQ